MSEDLSAVTVAADFVVPGDRTAEAAGSVRPRMALVNTAGPADSVRTAAAWTRSKVADRPTLGQVLDTLGPTIGRVLVAPGGLSARVSEHLIVDTRDEIPGVARGAILLAVGSRPGAADTFSLVRAAAQARAAAVVVKTHGEDAHELVSVCESGGIALVAADDRVSWRHLDSLLAAAVTTAGARDGHMVSAVGLGDLFALANAIAAAVGGAIAIEDPHQRVMAYSNLPHQPIDEVRQLGILGRQVPYDSSYPAVYRKVTAASGAVRISGGAPRDRLAVAVRAGTDVLATIWAVEGDTPFSASSAGALADAARVTAMHLLRQRSHNDVQRQAHGELLRALLLGESVADSLATWLHPMPDHLAIVAFALPSRRTGPAEIVGTQVADLVTVHSQMLSLQAGCVLLGDTVYALLPVTAGTTLRKLVEWAGTVLARADAALHVRLRAGIGGMVADPARVPSSRHDADQVLRVLARGSDDRRVAAIDDVRAAVALLELEDLFVTRPAMQLDSLRRMLRSDQDKDTRYAPTLRAYLDAFGDVATAAARVHVHVNTFRYRLRRMNELFGIDLSDADERLMLWLQLRVLESAGPWAAPAVGGAR